jgi:ABC-type glycerol-3-phosphate transport system substrate-binding protein
MFPKSVKGYYSLPVPSYNGYVVYTNGKNQAGAVDFLKFLGSERIMSYFDEIIGEFPVRLDVQGHDWVKNAEHLKNLVPVIQSPDTVYVEMPQYLPEYDRIMQEIGESGFQAVLLGREKPADYLNEWAAAMEQAYKRYLANK